MLAAQGRTTGQESAETTAARETAPRVFTASASFEAQKIASGLGEFRRASAGEVTAQREPSFRFIAELRPMEDFQCSSDSTCMPPQQKLIRHCLDQPT